MQFSARNALVLGLSLAIWGGRAFAVPIAPDALTNQEISRPLNTSTPDDYLIDLARAANINALADATNFPMSSSVLPYPATPGSIAGVKGEDREHWNASLINVMGDFVAQEKWSTLRPSERTFLFWSEPDPVALVKAQLPLAEAAERARFASAVAAQRAAGVPDADILDATSSDAKIKSVLLDTLKNQRGWTWSAARQNEKLDIRISLNELPPDLRALVLLQVQQIWIEPRDAQYFSGGFWSSEDLKVRIYSSNGSAVLGMQKDVADDAGDGKIDSQYDLTKLEDMESNGAPIEDVDVAPVTKSSGVLLEANEFGDNTMERVYDDLSNLIASPILDADPALQKEISLETKRLSLREVMAQVQQQSGVKLSLGADAPADKLLTARVDKMPLVTFLKTLSRLYGGNWEKAGDTYQMRGNQRGELHLKLLQMGDPYRYRYRFMFYNRADREQNRAALGRAIAKEIGLDALKTPQGVAFTSLTKPLQERVKNAIQESVAEDIGAIMYQSNALLTQQLAHGELDLHMANGVGLPANTPDGGVLWAHPMIFNGFQFNIGQSVGPPEMIQFFVSSRDGQLSAPIFRSLSYSTWVDPTIPVKAPSRRR